MHGQNSNFFDRRVGPPRYDHSLPSTDRQLGWWWCSQSHLMAWALRSDKQGLARRMLPDVTVRTRVWACATRISNGHPCCNLHTSIHASAYVNCITISIWSTNGMEAFKDERVLSYIIILLQLPGNQPCKILYSWAGQMVSTCQLRFE